VSPSQWFGRDMQIDGCHAGIKIGIKSGDGIEPGVASFGMCHVQ